jgi:hypothetical protein
VGGINQTRCDLHLAREHKRFSGSQFWKKSKHRAGSDHYKPKSVYHLLPRVIWPHRIRLVPGG